MRRWILGIFLLSGAGVVFLTGTYFFWAGTEWGELQSVRAEIKKNGLPVERRDFFPEFPADDRNAAPLLKRAAGIVRTMPKDSLALRCVPGTPGNTYKNDTARLPDAELAVIRSFLAEPAAAEVLRLLNEAASKEECDFARDYAKGVALPLEDATPMIPAIRLLLNHAWCLAKDGDVSGSAAEIRSAMKICSFYMRDPILIPWLVGITCEQMCLSSMMNLLGREEIASGEIEGLEACVKAHRELARPSLVRALDGERVFCGGSIFDQFLSRKIGPNAILSAVFGQGVLTETERKRHALTLWVYQNPLRPFLASDYAAYLRFILGMRKVILDPRAGEAEAERVVRAIPRTALLTQLSAPGFQNLTKKLHEVETSLDLALIGLGAERYRISNGHYPQELQEVPCLGPFPSDPFTKEEFHYKESDGNILLYSVGPDLVDNQGNPAKVNNKSDIVWSVRRALGSEEAR
ncbi:MAG: hypothetical protein D4R65_04485 [Verrucomicrobiaceae bacterium]|nr:MAG: hypothetical protein D4R65_04485 [Verrucomicrobiaceae bacterium]